MELLGARSKLFTSSFDTRHFFSCLCKIVAISSLLFLVACNKAPTVDAGADKTYYERSKIKLIATVVDEDEDDTHTYQWKQLSGIQTKQLGATDQSSFIVELPTASQDETFVFQVTVHDAAGEQSVDTVTITAKAYTTLAKLKFPDQMLEQCARTQWLHLAWRDMGEAEELRCNGLAINNLAGLEQAPNLKIVSLRQNDITDIAPLKHLRRIERLDLSENPLENVDILRASLTLKDLNLKHTQVSKLDALSGLRRVEVLNLAGLKLGKQSLSPVSKLSNLKVLRLNHSDIRDARELHTLSGLQELHLNSNALGKIAGLEKLSSLAILQLEDNSKINCKDLKAVQRALGERVAAPGTCVR